MMRGRPNKIIFTKMRNYPKLTMVESLERDHGWRIYLVDRMIAT